MTIGEGEGPAWVTVANTRDLGDLVITKTSSWGSPTGAVVNSITVDVVCTPGTYAWTDLELTAEDDWTVVLSRDPQRAVLPRSPRTRSPVGQTSVSPASVTIGEGEGPGVGDRGQHPRSG